MDDNFFLGSRVIKYPYDGWTGEVNAESSDRRRVGSNTTVYYYDIITTDCFQSIYSLYMTAVNHDVLLPKYLITSFCPFDPTVV